MRFDFTKTFDKIGKIFVRELRRGVERQVDIAGAPYSRPADSTLMSRKATKKGKGQGLSTSTGRMYVTHRTATGAWEYEAKKNGLRVYVSNKIHPQNGERYIELISWNSDGQDDVNKNIKLPPLMFPTTAGQVSLMKVAMIEANRIFALDAKKQIRDAANFKLKVSVNIA